MGTEDPRVGYLQTCRNFTTNLTLSLISVALTHDFAMSALLALSASHLAWQTKNPDTENLFYHHYGVATKGLHEAMGVFSEGNSEAVLAATLLLSWQTTEWQVVEHWDKTLSDDRTRRNWTSLQRSLATVRKCMTDMEGSLTQCRP